jgi:hypothetical protein
MQFKNPFCSGCGKPATHVDVNAPNDRIPISVVDGKFKVQGVIDESHFDHLLNPIPATVEDKSTLYCQDCGLEWESEIQETTENPMGVIEGLSTEELIKHIHEV